MFLISSLSIKFIVRHPFFALFLWVETPKKELLRLAENWCFYFSDALFSKPV